MGSFSTWRLKRSMKVLYSSNTWRERGAQWGKEAKGRHSGGRNPNGGTVEVGYVET